MMLTGMNAWMQRGNDSIKSICFLGCLGIEDGLLTQDEVLKAIMKPVCIICDPSFVVNLSFVYGCRGLRMYHWVVGGRRSPGGYRQGFRVLSAT